MPILLSSARQYATEVAYDMADDKADRLANRWIRQALQHLWRVHDWRHYVATQDLTLEPQVDGDDDLNVTEGSPTVTRDTNWDATWVTEEWDLIVPTDARRVFSLSAVATTTGTLGTGQLWTGDTANDLEYVLSRYRYDLPDDFIKRALLVQTLSNWASLSYVPPEDFDRLRVTYPGRRGSPPEVFTIRGTAGSLKIDFFPAPGEDYEPLRLTYIRKPTLPEVDDDGGDSVDWPEEHEDILHLAIEVQAARVQGEAAQVPMNICGPELERALASARSIDTLKGAPPRRLGLTFGGARPSASPWSYYVRATYTGSWV